MASVLQQCCGDAWEVIQGRKRIIRNRIIDVDKDFDQEEDSESTDYGWLSPKGEFYPVEFGKHQAWSADYLLSLYRDGKISYDKAKISSENASDLLIESGWILIHNPSRNRIEISKNESKTETKPQKEFLYEFFYKHGMQERANKLYE